MSDMPDPSQPGPFEPVTSAYGAPPADPYASPPADPGARPPAPGTAPVFAASTDILAAGPAEPARTAASWWLVGGVALLVLALVGGVTAGLRFLSGGGAQPEDALASGAFAFAEVDLDPPAGQKVDGLRFIRKFPTLAGRTNGTDDLRELAFAQLAGTGGIDGIEFDADVAPWLGDRLAVAAYPAAGSAGSAGQPGAPGVADVVVAVQVTDRGAAQEGLAKLARQTGADLGFVVGDDYALLADSQEEADRAAAAAIRGTLADDPDLGGDLAALGDGVAAFWMDLGRASTSALGGLAAMSGLGPAGAATGLLGGAAAGTGGPQGRLAYVLRFDGGSALELVGRATGMGTTASVTTPVSGMDRLPATTVAAVGMTGGADLVRGFFDGLRSSLGPEAYESFVGQADRRLGLSLPADAELLLGSNTLLALDGRSSETGSVAAPPVGAVVTTDPVAADRVLRRLTAAAARSGLPVPLTYATTPDGYVVAFDGEQRDRLARSGALGEEDGFRDALPDLDDAGLVLWVDVPATLETVGTGPVDPDVAALRSIGVTATGDDAGDGAFRIRVLTR